MDHTPRVPGFDHRRASAHDLRRTLRSLLASGDPVVMPGCTDALGARLIEQAGFGVAYATGAGLANAQFGLPDIGLISQSEVVDHLGRLTAAVDIPIVVDADTGYGGPAHGEPLRACRCLGHPARGSGDAEALRALR